MAHRNGTTDPSPHGARGRGGTGESGTRLNLPALERAIRSREPAALLVLPRILRRVIRQDCCLPRWGLKLPHRKSYVIGREAFLAIVDEGELGQKLDGRAERLILLPQPSVEELDETPAEELLVRWWRLLFHARVHLALDQAIATGRLTAAALRRRIHQIGPMAFDEIRTVLKHEDLLLPPRDDQAVYVEFAAVYLELRYFAPSLLARYFPALASPAAVGAILAQDLDATELYLSSRPSGAPDPKDQPEPTGLDEGTAPEDQEEELPVPASRPSPRRYRRWMAQAQRAAEVGNLVRAAIRRLAAARVAEGKEAAGAAAGAQAALDRLTQRLTSALELAAQHPPPWREALEALAELASRGTWTVEGRLLYDLQKVCADHEREIHTVDLVEWALSLGARPIKRALPGQRDILMAKHLRGAQRRLPSVGVSMEQRHQLSLLIREGMERVEARVRQRLHPLTAEVLGAVGLHPRNVPERVARKKLIEEMLDRIVERGFLTMGDFRDALSRNNLKLPDVSHPSDLIHGNQLLRGDRRLAVALDGVYRRGEFYLRWMQHISGLAFGTRPGRIVMRYGAIPFGGAFLAMEFVQHILEKEFVQRALQRWGAPPDPHFSLGWSVALLGLFLLGLINCGPFRRGLWRALRGAYRAARAVLVEAPRWLLHRPWVEQILHSPPMVLAVRWGIKPLALTAVVWAAIPTAELTGWMSAMIATGIFLSLNLLLNSRLGRYVEEVVVDWAVQTWHRFGLRFVMMLLSLVADLFRGLLRTIERVLYAVDEWLRFRSGQSQFTLFTKAVLGAVWFAVTYVLRFAINLLIEPQINPIKHFPVVTVSHKLLLPTIPFCQGILVELGVKPGMAWTVATAVITSIPGVFGFLVWELKENWRLYEANRPRGLGPVLVGHHGETMPRLLRPGLHSGTLPKRYAKLRRAERRARRKGNWKPVRKQLQALANDGQAIRHFFEREFSALFCESPAWRAGPVHIERIRLGPTVIQIAFACPDVPGTPMWIAVEVRGEWIVAGITRTGWLDRLTPEEREVLAAALLGVYKASGIELMRQQLEAELSPPAYDIVHRGLLVWPDAEFETEILYDLRREGRIRPTVLRGTAPGPTPHLDRERLVFAAVPIAWQDWVTVWEQALPHRGELPERIASFRILPPRPPATPVAPEPDIDPPDREPSRL